jgi:hypothetical protein
MSGILRSVVSLKRLAQALSKSGCRATIPLGLSIRRTSTIAPTNPRGVLRRDMTMTSKHFSRVAGIFEVTNVSVLTGVRAAKRDTRRRALAPRQRRSKSPGHAHVEDDQARLSGSALPNVPRY